MSLKNEIKNILKNPYVKYSAIATVIAGIIYKLWSFLLFLLIGLLIGPGVTYINFTGYHHNVVSSVLLYLLAVIIIGLGIKFRSKVIGKIFIVMGILIWAMVGMVELGRWA